MRVLKSQHVAGVRSLDPWASDSKDNMGGKVVADDLELSPNDTHVDHSKNTKDVVFPPEGVSQKEQMLGEMLAACEKRLQARDDELECLRRDYEAIKTKYTLESDKIFEDQKNAGYEKGIESGKQDGLSETNDIRRCLGVLYKALEEDFRISVIKQRPVIIELVFSIVTKILGEKYSDDKLIVGIVNKNINALRLKNAIKITVSPADFKIMSDYLHNEEDKKFLHEFDLCVSNVVECGGCIIETDTGGLDARLDIQLTELRKIFCASYG